MKYLETTVKMEKMTPNGVSKKVREKYLVDAITVGEAEKNIVEVLKPFISGDFQVVSVKQSNIDSVFGDFTATPYIVKIDTETIDERTGQVARVRFKSLFWADSIKDAIEMARKEFPNYEIVSVQKSAIVDVC